MAGRSSVLVMILAFVALFSLLYYSETFGQKVPLVSHSKPQITKEQALDTAMAFLNSQVANITRIRTQQELTLEHGYDGKAPNQILLGYLNDRNDTLIRLDSTNYTTMAHCTGCVGHNKEFRAALEGHIFYWIELYYNTEGHSGYAGIYVDAINGKIIYPMEIP